MKSKLLRGALSLAYFAGIMLPVFLIFRFTTLGGGQTMPPIIWWLVAFFISISLAEYTAVKKEKPAAQVSAKASPARSGKKHTGKKHP